MKSADHAVRTAVAVAISGALAHLGLFVLLHVIEPEYDPRWRFVSEYSNGQYGLDPATRQVTILERRLSTSIVRLSANPTRTCGRPLPRQRSILCRRMEVYLNCAWSRSPMRR